MELFKVHENEHDDNDDGDDDIADYDDDDEGCRLESNERPAPPQPSLTFVYSQRVSQLHRNQSH